MSKNEIKRSSSKNDKLDAFAEPVAALQRGEVIVFPTETLYGLGADALNGEAVEKVYKLKGRDPRNPIPVLVADQTMLEAVVADIPTWAVRLIANYWPGPLTLVLPARPGLPAPLVNSTGGIGVRQSSQSVATQLVRALGRPLTATSANPSGKIPARTVTEARSYFGNSIQVFIDAGLMETTTGSTVVEIVGPTVRIIREGKINAVELRKFLGKEICR